MKVLARIKTPKILNEWLDRRLETELLKLKYKPIEIQRIKTLLDVNKGMLVMMPISDMYVEKVSEDRSIKFAHRISGDAFSQKPSFLSKLAIKSFRAFHTPISVAHVHHCLLIYFKDELVWGCQITAHPLKPLITPHELDLNRDPDEVDNALLDAIDVRHARDGLRGR